MTHDERMVIVGDAAAARFVEVMQDLQQAASSARRGLPFFAAVEVAAAMLKLKAVRLSLIKAARADQDGVPTESCICGICGEHESRCQCSETCNVCGVRDCDDLHETDAAGYEPRARA